MTQMTEKKKPLIILTGPTAVGKTAASIGLAKAIGGEIISADSMQVYRHMDIGSAKILPEEMKGVKHYLIDVLNPEEEFNVAVFQKMAKDAMVEIYKRGRIPIVVGGTGFYIQALLYDIDFEKGEENTAYRKKLEMYAKEHGAQALHDRLREADPKSADAIHANNVKRVIRALEYYHETGTKISEHNEAEREKDSPYQFAYFVLNDVRSRLYERIDRRVDLMVEQGLVDEVTALKTRGCTREMVSMQGLGYKEILDYLEELAQRYYVCVEYGVESVNDTVLRQVNRGHDFAVAEQAIRATAGRGITIGAHLIFGLPGESHESMLEGAIRLCE